VEQAQIGLSLIFLVVPDVRERAELGLIVASQIRLNHINTRIIVPDR
jgi:hypothetical protein